MIAPRSVLLTTYHGSTSWKGTVQSTTGGLSPSEFAVIGTGTTYPPSAPYSNAAFNTATSPGFKNSSAQTNLPHRGDGSSCIATAPSSSHSAGLMVYLAAGLHPPTVPG